MFLSLSSILSRRHWQGCLASRFIMELFLFETCSSSPLVEPPGLDSGLQKFALPWNLHSFSVLNSGFLILNTPKQQAHVAYLLTARAASLLVLHADEAARCPFVENLTLLPLVAAVLLPCLCHVHTCIPLLVLLFRSLQLTYSSLISRLVLWVTLANCCFLVAPLLRFL